MSVDHYPLQWPDGWPRTTHPHNARFTTRLAEACDGLMRELQRLGASQIVLSSNLMVRKDGLPYAKQRQPDDGGVAVYFLRQGTPQVIACDRWLKIEDNIQAVRLTVEAIRGMERWGTTEMVSRAFRGFEALREGTGVESAAWWTILGVDPDASLEVIEAAYRRQAKTQHPDVVGGSAEVMTVLNAAVQQARRDRNPD